MQMTVNGKEYTVQGAWSRRVNWVEVSPQKASSVARAHGVSRLPRMGREVRLSEGVYLVNVSGTYGVRVHPSEGRTMADAMAWALEK